MENINRHNKCNKIMNKITFLILAIVLTLASCKQAQTSSTNNTENNKEQTKIDSTIYPGIYNTQLYLELIQDKNIGIVGNQTSIINSTHLVDTLLKLEQNIVRVFSPEHGFRGKADAGASIDNSIDTKTGLPIISLYGSNKKPKIEQLSGIDIMIFDLQDVGVRFYTYISTLHYIMEACAENKIPLIILDRPNPNAHYVDGAILDTANLRSFIGMHPVPVVYGMTIGEYGQMINGEKWLKNGIQCDLSVIPCENYTHQSKYSLPIKPSPNLPNDRSIELYPTLCFFESSNLSVGRGTDKQFQIIGHPQLNTSVEASFVFTPIPNEGASNPKLNNQLCYGFDLSEDNSIFDWKTDQLNISIIKKIYELFPDKENFWKKSNSIDLISGYTEFKTEIKNNVSEEEIRAGWQAGLDEFKKIRKKYLIY